METYPHGYIEARNLERVRVGEEAQLPPRLGYGENENIGEWAEDDYLIIEKEILNLSTTLYKRR